MASKPFYKILSLTYDVLHKTMVGSKASQSELIGPTFNVHELGTFGILL